MSVDYAGEGIYVALTNPKTFNGKHALTPADVTSVTLEIYNSDFTTKVFGPVAMPWSAEDATWVITWDTRQDGAATPMQVPPGTYKAKVTIIDVNGIPSIEYQRHRLKRRQEVPA